MSGKPTLCGYICAKLNELRILLVGPVMTMQEFCDVIVLRNANGETDAMYQRLLALKREELVAFANQEGKDGRGRSPVQLAAAFPEAFSIFQLLIEEGGADLGKGIPYSRITPLMDAARLPHCVETTRYLVEVLRVNIEATDSFNRTAVDHVLEQHYGEETQRNFEVLEILLRNGANPNALARDCWSLKRALCRLDTHLIEFLLRYGFDPTQADCNGHTALQIVFNYTYYHGQTACELVHLLLNKEAELYLRDDKDLDDTWVSPVEMPRGYGATPLDRVNYNLRRDNADRAGNLGGGNPHAARRLLQQYNQVDTEIVQLLLQHYQRVAMKRTGNISLHWILQEAIYGNDGVVLPLGKLTISQLVTLLNLLVTANPDLATTVNASGALPLHSACRQTEMPLEVIQCLVDLAPGTVHSRDRAGNLPLHALCTSKPSVRAVQCLLDVQVPNIDAGDGGEAALTATNHLGFMPMAVAALFDASTDVLFLLLSEGHDAGTMENLRRHFLDRDVSSTTSS